MCASLAKATWKLQLLCAVLVAIVGLAIVGHCGVAAAAEQKRLEGFLRGKMRPMHFSSLHRTFVNMGGPFSHSTSWKPTMRLSPYSPPMASSLIAPSENDLSHHSSSHPAATDPGKEKFVPFIGARALSNLPEFFEHLRQNLEIMRQKEEAQNEEREQSPDYPQDEQQAGDEEGYHQTRGSGSIETNEPRAMAVTSGNQEWMWPAAIFFRGKNLERAPRVIV